MTTELLEIEPRELKFTFELKKQSSCSVRLINKCNEYVAFKVKTTSPKKYSVRPNTGVLEPKSACDFIVTMQAQRVAPPDMSCKDKFLVQSAVVNKGMTDADITSSTFTKGTGTYVEESKLRVVLVSPPDSPVLSPLNGLQIHSQVHEVPEIKDRLLEDSKHLSQEGKMAEDFQESKRRKNEVEEIKNENGDNIEAMEEDKGVRESEIESIEEPLPAKSVEMELILDKSVGVESEKEPTELHLAKFMEEMKSKISELEFKLSESEATVSKLREERRLSTEERGILERELMLLRSKRGIRSVRAGFPFLYVAVVALVSILLGYLLHR